MEVKNIKVKRFKVKGFKALKSKAFKSFLDERRYAPFIGYAGINPAYKVKINT